VSYFGKERADHNCFGPPTREAFGHRHPYCATIYLVPHTQFAAPRSIEVPLRLKLYCPDILIDTSISHAICASSIQVPLRRQLYSCADFYIAPAAPARRKSNVEEANHQRRAVVVPRRERPTAPPRTKTVGTVGHFGPTRYAARGGKRPI
jgi:hypothetical protein